MNGEAESLKKHSRDSLVYLTTCMIGHLVEAHLIDGSVYSGVFHSADVEKDFGIILKMASLIKDGTCGGNESGSEVVRKPPTETFFIPADELVQVVAKDLSVFSDGMLNAAQSEKSVELLADSSGKGYGGETQPSQNETNVDQSCSISDDHAGQLPSEQKSKDFPVQGSSISESQLGERRKNNNPEAAHSNRSPEESVSAHRDIQCGGSLGDGGTLASETVADKETQVSQLSGKTKYDSSFKQSASRSSQRGPAPSTSIRPGLSRSSSISSLPSSEKSTLNPNAKEFKPSQPAAPVRPQSPIANASFYYAAPPAPVQQMHRMPAGYGIQPQYPRQHLLRYPGHEYPETYYPPNAPPWFQQQQMIYMQMSLPYQPEKPHNQG